MNNAQNPLQQPGLAAVRFPASRLCGLAAALMGGMLLCFHPAGTSAKEDTGADANQDQITLTWDAPATKADGSPLKDLAGYIISYGPEPGNYTGRIKVPLESKKLSCRKKKAVQEEKKTKTECRYVIRGLEKENRFFAVKAYDRAGKESDFSAEQEKD